MTIGHLYNNKHLIFKFRWLKIFYNQIEKLFTKFMGLNLDLFLKYFCNPFHDQRDIVP